MGEIGNYASPIKMSQRHNRMSLEKLIWEADPVSPLDGLFTIGGGCCFSVTSQFFMETVRFGSLRRFWFSSLQQFYLLKRRRLSPLLLPHTVLSGLLPVSWPTHMGLSITVTFAEHGLCQTHSTEINQMFWPWNNATSDLQRGPTFRSPTKHFQFNSPFTCRRGHPSWWWACSKAPVKAIHAKLLIRWGQ